MIRRIVLVLCAVLLAAPAPAIEPEQRQVVVAHNRVWDGFSYKENFVPSDTGQMLLIADADNAVAFVTTWEYYWPLSRQKYVAFERQNDPVEGTLVVRRGGEVIAEITPQNYSIVYPDGAVNGNGHLVWGEEADSTFAAFKQEERDFAQRFIAARQAETAYENALRDAAIARLGGKGVQPVTPPPPGPEPMLKLVTEPDIAYRINLPEGDYRMELVREGEVVAEKQLRVIRPDARDALSADVIPEERWTRPLQVNAAAERIYARPGAEFYVTLNHASRFDGGDYVCLTQPQACQPDERELWIRRQPAREIAGLDLAWGESGGSARLELTALKVEQTQGAAFGYVVRPALPEESADLSAFVIKAPDNAGIHTATLSLPDAAGAFVRHIVLVQPRSEVLVWLLALLPGLFGGFLTWRRWRRPD